MLTLPVYKKNYKLGGTQTPSMKLASGLQTARNRSQTELEFFKAKSTSKKDLNIRGSPHK